MMHEEPISTFVLASSKELDRAKWARDTLREASHFRLAFDWMQQIDDVGAANPEATEEQRIEWITRGLHHVGEAQLIWLLLPETPTSGAWVEWGYALGLRNALPKEPRALIASGPNFYGSIFTAATDVYYPTDDVVRYMMWNEPHQIRTLL